MECLRPDRYDLISEMIDFINKHDIIWYSALKHYAYNNRFDDWFQVLRDRRYAYTLKTYINSHRYGEKRKRGFNEIS